MSDVVNKNIFLENLITRLARDNFNKANDRFAEKYGYDLRDTNNSDKLKFISWLVDDKILELRYKEITPHDVPYYISLYFNPDLLRIT
jgi:hypothetical protein